MNGSTYLDAPSVVLSSQAGYPGLNKSSYDLLKKLHLKKIKVVHAWKYKYAESELVIAYL